MGNVQEKGKAQKKSKLNFVDEDSGTKGRSPPGSQADAEKKPKPRKLKSDAQKAKERAEQLRFGKAEITVDEASRMTKEQKREMYASAALLTAVHRKIEEYEDDNVGIKSAHEVEKGAELAGRVSDSRYAKNLKKRKKKLESKAAKQKAAAGKQPAEKAGETGSNPISKAKQRQAYQQQARTAAQAARTGTTAAGQKAAASGKSTVQSGVNGVITKGKEVVGGVAKGAAVFAKSHAHLLVIGGVLAMLLLLMLSAFSSCSILFGGTTHVMGQTTYTAEDEDIRGAEEDYKQLERQLQLEIDMMEITHPGMDEYQYDLDPIEHDPWELTSYLTTLHDDYTRSEVQGTLKDTFEKQYKLKTWVEPQIRYRVVIIPSPVPPYFTTTLEPYVYLILHVELENRGLETVIREELDDDQWKRYEILQDTKGGRPYLFNGSLSWGSSDGSGEAGIDYQVPAEALTDPEFAAMLQEAEKYLGTPYVWGGSTPETGFDCSGYVCWVLNESGWDVGRTTANGLWQQSTKISEAEAKPGDLVFFEGTYDTPGASHVGIYVGDGMMISAGDPIKYSNIHSSYWDGHLLGFGRIPK